MLDKTMLNNLTEYIKNSKLELKKVNWPSKNTTVNYTILVIMASIVVAAFLALVDYIFSLGIEKLIVR